MDLIPEKLRQDHEDNQVVFFCGAGVSKPAGLPTFKELVCLTLTDLLPCKDDCQPGSTEALAWHAFREERYDEALGILESPGEGGYEPKDVREKVRYHLSKPKTKTLDKHLILSRLADLDKENGRLVTTNFDDLFEKTQTKLRRFERSCHRMAVHVAPGLPPAKPQTFRGLIHLHGRLCSSQDDRQLVLTTADFGIAYMLEGWALRFSVDLFRHFHVVFIGYSVKDPTMRYLVSAVAAARGGKRTIQGALCFRALPPGRRRRSRTTVETQGYNTARLRCRRRTPTALVRVGKMGQRPSSGHRRSPAKSGPPWPVPTRGRQRSCYPRDGLGVQGSKRRKIFRGLDG